jgi:hypothetical protein
MASVAELLQQRLERPERKVIAALMLDTAG